MNLKKASSLIMSELCNAHQVISLLQKSRQIFWLAKYLDIDEKSKVEMIPLSKKRFLIEVK